MVAARLSLLMHQRKMLLVSGFILLITALIYAAFKQNKKYRSTQYNSLQKIKQYRTGLEKAAKIKAQKKGSMY